MALLSLHHKAPDLVFHVLCYVAAAALKMAINTSWSTLTMYALYQSLTHLFHNAAPHLLLGAFTTPAVAVASNHFLLKMSD